MHAWVFECMHVKTEIKCHGFVRECTFVSVLMCECAPKNTPRSDGFRLAVGHELFATHSLNELQERGL